MKSAITRIGKDAINEQEPILILFGDQASEAIEEVSIIQSFTEKEKGTLLSKGDQIVIGGQSYVIEHIGKNVNENLHSLGHLTIVFKEYDPERFLETSVYVTPYQLPRLEIGMEIDYRTNPKKEG